jgi:hypothetical protein
MLRPVDATATSPRPRPDNSPWHRLGLRWNPFGEPPTEELPSLIVPIEPTPPDDWLQQPRRVQQYLGEAGRGKSARLRRLSAVFPGTAYIYLAEDATPPPLPDPVSTPGPLALLLDEAQRLPRRRRRQLFAVVARHGRSLVMASHADLSDEVRAAGLACRTTVIAGLRADDLRAIIDRRIAWARLAAGPPPPPAPRLADAERLIAKFGDDVRAILDHLYEIYQDWAVSGERYPWPDVS